MRKLELKDIVGYLPYGMNFINKDGVILRMDALQVSGYNVWAHQRYVKGKKDERDINYPYLKSLNCSGEGDYLRRIKPILRPMSDLTKYIAVKGYNDDKAFVPMVALAERAFEIEIDAVTGFAQNGKCRGVSFIFDYVEYGFSYSEDTDSFHTQIISPKQNIITDNQSQLFDLLNQWNFDYRNLIGEGLAIDINTFKKEDRQWKL